MIIRTKNKKIALIYYFLLIGRCAIFGADPHLRGVTFSVATNTSNSSSSMSMGMAQMSAHNDPLYLSSSEHSILPEHQHSSHQSGVLSLESQAWRHNSDFVDQVKQYQFEGNVSELKAVATKLDRNLKYNPMYKVYYSHYQALHNYVKSMLADPKTALYQEVNHGTLTQALDAEKKLAMLGIDESTWIKIDAILENRFPAKMKNWSTETAPPPSSVNAPSSTSIMPIPHMSEIDKMMEPIIDMPLSDLQLGPELDPADMTLEMMLSTPANITTDMMFTAPSAVINISPEIDAQVQQRLSQLSSNELQTLNQLSDDVGAILFEMHQAGELTPANQATFFENLQIARTAISKIARKDIPYFQARITTTFMQRIKDPAGIITDQVKGVYALSKFLCEMYLGPYYMSEKQQWESFEYKLKAFTETIDGLKNITADQVADLTGVIAADFAFNFGVSKAVTCLQKIGATSRLSKEFAKAATALERQFAQSSEQLATVDGVLLNCPNEFVVESSLLKNTSSKIGSSSRSALTKVSNMKEVFAKNDFGQALKKCSIKTKLIAKTDSQVYKLLENLPAYGLKKGDLFYLDKFHCDHIEVFWKNEKFKTVLNLDGSENIDKLLKGAGRRLL